MRTTSPISDATLAEGASLSNAPDAPELIYGSIFFPFSTAVPVEVGDTVTVSLQANLVGEDYLWRWNSKFAPASHPGPVKACFRQSTFHSVPVSPGSLRKREIGHVATLNEEGQIDQTILTWMDGQTSLGEIARRVSSRFPERFPCGQDALTRVGDLSETYSR